LSAAASLASQSADFLEAMSPRYSDGTLRIHRSSLQRLQMFCTEASIGLVAEFDEAAMATLDVWLQGRRLSPSTVYRTLGTVKLFLRWAYKMGLCLWDGESYRIVNPKARGPVPPTAAVMARILELPDRGNPLGLRDLFVLELLYVLGLRRRECTELDLVSLDLGAETLFVVGKYADERLLPVGPKLKETAWRYLRKARPGLAPAAGETALLLGDAGQRLTPEAVAYIVKKYGAAVGIKLAPHQLRHACATHLVEAGMQLAQVQQLLGHRRIDSTERYAQIHGREMQREFLRSHPRARR
jgi:integrase/recombinase XerC